MHSVITPIQQESTVAEATLVANPRVPPENRCTQARYARLEDPNERVRTLSRTKEIGRHVMPCLLSCPKLTDERPRPERRADGIQSSDEVGADPGEGGIHVGVGASAGSISTPADARRAQRQRWGVRVRLLHLLPFGRSRGSSSLRLIIAFREDDAE